MPYSPAGELTLKLVSAPLSDSILGAMIVLVTRAARMASIVSAPEV